MQRPATLEQDLRCTLKRILCHGSRITLSVDFTRHVGTAKRKLKFKYKAYIAEGDSD